METVGQGLKITDTRPCAVQSEIYLEGLAQQIYLLCDRALTSKELIKALRQSYNLTLSWEEIQPIVEQLQQLKILIHLSHRFLSLAVTGDIPPLPTEQDFPGGSILMAETEISKDEKLCLDLIRSLLPEIQLT
jgi:magnesium-protoporphyrin IX monomethyl ester (oxidative) cyclase